MKRNQTAMLNSIVFALCLWAAGNADGQPLAAVKNSVVPAPDAGRSTGLGQDIGRTLLATGSAPQLYPFWDASGMYGYIDRNGAVVCQPQFGYALRFTEGLGRCGALASGGSSTPVEASAHCRR